MMNVMNTTGMSYGAGLFWLHLHWFFGLFALVGFILLTMWALRSLAKEQLKTLTVWLLVFGIVGSLFTAPFAPWGFWHRGMWAGKHMKYGQDMQQVREMMMEHDEGTEGEEHEEHEEMGAMMRSMMP